MLYPEKNKSSTPYLKIPADHILESIKQIVDINKNAKYKIKEVYGSIPFFTISARPDHILPPVTKDSFVEYLSCLSAHNIEYNYIINLFHKVQEVQAQIDFLLDVGITKFTVADNRVIQYLNKQGIKPTLSVTRNIRNKEELQLIINKHFLSNVCLSEDLNRDIKGLANFIKNFKSLKFEVIVNSLCFQNCPNKKRHYKYIKFSRPQTVDPYGSWCDVLKKKKDNVMKCCWLLPQDLASLENIQVSCFKIAGRELINKDAYQFIKAYATGIYSGDLMRLLLLGNKIELEEAVGIETRDIETAFLII